MAKLMQTARMIVAELERRGIEVEADIPENTSMLRFEYANKSRLLLGCVPEFASALATEICRSKLMTDWVIRRQTRVTMPQTTEHTTIESSREFMERVGQIVVKPQDGAHGQGVTVGVSDANSLVAAVNAARSASKTETVLLQEMVKGDDVRVLVLDGQPIAAAYRIPPHITGDGTSTLRQLIEQENTQNPMRGQLPYTKPLNQIDMVAAERFLGDDIDSVPTKGEKRVVVGAANIGSGGEAHECLGELPEGLKLDASEAARAVGAFLCGVDFMYDPDSGGYRLIELNSSPSFGLHVSPSKGNGVDVARLYVDTLLEYYDRELG